MEEENNLILKNIEKSKEEILTLASDLVKAPTVNPPGDTNQAVDLIKSYLNYHGIDCRTYEPVNGKVSIVSEIKGVNEGKCLIFNGHLDVVPPGDEARWSFEPFSGEIKQGYLLGRGSSDMKGGVAALLGSFIALSRIQDKISGSVKLMLVADEETGGMYGTYWLVEEGIVSGDAVLVAEPTNLRFFNIGEKGVVWVRFKAKGDTAHGSLGPYIGKNAIISSTNMANEVIKLAKLRTKFPSKIRNVLTYSRNFISESTGYRVASKLIDSISVNLGTISGGIKINVVPDSCEMEVDFRLPIGFKPERLKRLLLTISKKYDVDFEIISTSDPNYTNLNETFINTFVKESYSIIKEKVKPVVSVYASDGRFFRFKGIPTILYGPGNLRQIHSYDEKVKVNDIITASKIYSRVAISFFNKFK